MPVELLIPLGFRPHSSQGIQLFFLAKWYYFIMISKKIRSRFLGKGNLYWCSYMELDLLPWALQSSTTRQPCLRRTSLIFRGDLYVPNLWSSTWSGSRGASGGRVGSIGISFICPQSQWGALVESVLEKKSLFCLSHWIATWQHLWLWTVMTKAMLWALVSTHFQVKMNSVIINLQIRGSDLLAQWFYLYAQYLNLLSSGNLKQKTYFIHVNAIQERLCPHG